MNERKKETRFEGKKEIRKERAKKIYERKKGINKE